MSAYSNAAEVSNRLTCRVRLDRAAFGTHDEAVSARQYIMAALIGAETVSGLRGSVLED
jgi:hypothetical protein